MRVRYALGCSLAAVALSFSPTGFAPTPSVQAQQSPQAAPKTAPPQADKVELLFVQNGVAGSYDGKTLTLRGVGPTLYFADRPARVTGQVRTSEFVRH